MSDKLRKLSTDAYKGVRDFYPEDMAIENQIFSIWRNVAQKYGYEEYGASVLEPAELYSAKTGEEIVNEQTYTFTDRGDRSVTLRPEMTPTLARMVAAKKRDLVFPLRWFSIPNLFRYEQPQRGRLREHWQLNVDLFGVDSIWAEVEVIAMASEITRAYGLSDSNFEIRINNRQTINAILDDKLGLNQSEKKEISRLIDKREKIGKDAFNDSANKVISSEKLTILNSLLNDSVDSSAPGVDQIKKVISELNKLGISNVRFEPGLMRGFDYYTGIVFEIFDLNPANNRSVLGGGRYDELLSIFGNEKVSAVGFGAGDVIAKDLIETYGNLKTDYSPVDIGICLIGDENAEFATKIANNLRSDGKKVSIDYSGKKISDQIAHADRKKIPKIIVIGAEEAKTGKVKIKDLKTGETAEL